MRLKVLTNGTFLNIGWLEDWFDERINLEMLFVRTEPFDAARADLLAAMRQKRRLWSLMPNMPKNYL